MSPSAQPGFEASAVPSADIPPSMQAASLAPTTHSIVLNGVTPPASPIATSSGSPLKSPRPGMSRAPRSFSVQQPKTAGSLYPPATEKGFDGKAGQWDESMVEADMVLELADGLALSGHSFGAKRSIAGECVFQTGQAHALRLCPAYPFRYGRLPGVTDGSLLFVTNFDPYLPLDWQLRSA